MQSLFGHKIENSWPFANIKIQTKCKAYLVLIHRICSIATEYQLQSLFGKDLANAQHHKTMFSRSTTLCIRIERDQMKPNAKPIW